MAKTKTKPSKRRSFFTPKKWICFAASLLLFSTVVSLIVTAHVSDSRAGQFLRSMFTGRGEVVSGALELDDADAVNIPKGEIGYFINKNVIFPDGYSIGDVLLQNPEQCGYTLRLRIYLADGSSDKPIYTSPRVHPGQYISGDKLSRYVHAGSYECTFTVTAYSLEDGSEQGRRSGFMTVTVVC